jgi:hypothetical protein
VTATFDLYFTRRVKTMQALNMMKNDWMDFVSSRIDEACQRAGKTEEYAEDEKRGNERYNAIIAALPGEEDKKLFIAYVDMDPTGTILRDHCYQTGFFDGLAFGMKAADRGGAFDA